MSWWCSCSTVHMAVLGSTTGLREEGGQTVRRPRAARAARGGVSCRPNAANLRLRLFRKPSRWAWYISIALSQSRTVLRDTTADTCRKGEIYRRSGNRSGVTTSAYSVTLIAFTRSELEKQGREESAGGCTGCPAGISALNSSGLDVEIWRRALGSVGGGRVPRCARSVVATARSRSSVSAAVQNWTR